MVRVTFAQALSTSVAFDFLVRQTRARLNIERVRMRACLRHDAARYALVKVTAAGCVNESSAFVLRRALVFTCASASRRTDVRVRVRRGDLH